MVLETDLLVRHLEELRAGREVAVPVYDFEAGVTRLSHDSFSGLVYASLSDLSVVSVNAFTAEIADVKTSITHLKKNLRRYMKPEKVSTPLPSSVALVSTGALRPMPKVYPLKMPPPMKPTPEMTP